MKNRKTYIHFDASHEPMHFRLCHLCGHLNESNLFITRCHSCSRALALIAAEIDFSSNDGRNSQGHWHQRAHEEFYDDEGSYAHDEGDDDEPVLQGLSALF